MPLPRGRNGDGFPDPFRVRRSGAYDDRPRAGDPLWDVLLGMHMLQTDDEPAVFGPWRRRTRARLTPIERELLTLAPPVGYSPDFLTPAESAAWSRPAAPVTPYHTISPIGTHILTGSHG